MHICATGSAASPTALPVAALEYMGFMRVTVLGGALEILVVISAIFIFGVSLHLPAAHASLSQLE